MGVKGLTTFLKDNRSSTASYRSVSVTLEPEVQSERSEGAGSEKGAAVEERLWKKRDGSAVEGEAKEVDSSGEDNKGVTLVVDAWG